MMKRYLQAILTIFIVNTPVISQITVPQILAPDSTNMVKIGADNTVNNEIDVDFIKINKRVATRSMSSSERQSLVKPATGLIIFDTDLNLSFKFDGDEWHQLYIQGIGNKNTKEIKNRDGIDSRLSPSDGLPFDSFGWSVSISNNYAIIGSPQDVIKGKQSQGSAYIFRKTKKGWIEDTKLIATDGQAYDTFGSSVAISGNYAIVGSPHNKIGNNSSQGSAYIFQKIGKKWIQKAKIFDRGGFGFSRFGMNVCISGNFVVVENNGKAYIYHKINQNWIFDSILYPANEDSKENPNDNFDVTTISVLGDLIIVGSCLDNGKKGCVFIFKRIGKKWIQQQKLVADDGKKEDYFGLSLAISKDFLAIGAKYANDRDNKNHGAVYIFQNQNGSWVQNQKLTAFDGLEGGEFGNSLAISENYLFVSSLARKKITNQPENGAIYIFQKLDKKWKYIRQFIEIDGGNSDFHYPSGVSVGLTNSNFLIGSLGNESVSFGTLPFLNRKVESKK